ncbi:recombinase B [Mycobacteroides abscessus subsp. abscessus]|uniref:AAA family ATPase n=1 Tax=Mycobacteroides abscessus TaxID=36809 RepID=UPI00092BDCB1|nr:AAA family ATPase [Mycobacteroides abscessus]SIJ22625.1 recombinase B [Mycobacteroides abscessus subsp. abscessus]SLH38114.1 recombinase B [Mycobacteroides abscessus subsp. abscessus]
MRTLPKQFSVGREAEQGPPPALSARPVSAPAQRPPTQDDAASWPGRELLDSPALARILLAAWSGDPGVICPACPGAGKTRLVSLVAAALAHRAGLRVAVAAQTREQAAELARRITAVSDRAALITSSGKRHVRPTGKAGAKTVSRVRWSRTSGGEILIGTAARWLYVDPNMAAADVLIVDEAWQCTYADLGALGALARQVVAVGDPGQIDPVVTGSTARWDGQATGPHQPAPAALIAAHGEAMSVHRLADSWRLGPVTCALVSKHFYPDMPFTSRRPSEAVISADGTVLPEIVSRPVDTRHGPTDPALLNALADRVRELTWHEYRRSGITSAVTGEDIAVVVPHVAQAGAMRALLGDVPGVLIGTVNALQGLERPAVVALHPMAGYRSAEPFALDAGRTCVTLTRHRAHLTVITDPGSRSALAATDDPQAVQALAVLESL